MLLMPETEMKLIDVFPEWFSGNGIFRDIYSVFDVPWGSTVSSEILDTSYFGNYSGDKYPSPLINKLMRDGKLSDSARLAVAQTIVAINSLSWTKLWEAMNEDYNPLYNYFGDEDYTKNITNTGTDSLVFNLSHRLPELSVEPSSTNIISIFPYV